MRKGADSGPTLVGLHAKVNQLNNGILPPGVKMEPMIDRSDLLRYTLGTVMHNLGEGMILVTVILFLFLFNARAALIVALTIPFSLLFASILARFDESPGQPALAGRAGFRHGRGWRRGHGGKHRAAHVPAPQPFRNAENVGGNHPRRRPRSPAARVLRHRHHHHGLYADLHAPANGGPSVPAHGLDRGILPFSAP